MNSMFKLLQYPIWEKGTGPPRVFAWLLIVSFAMLYAVFFKSLFDTFGNAVRIFPAVYLVVASLSWGVRGAVSVSLVSSVLDVFLYHYHGYEFEGGPVGPLGSLLVSGLIGLLGDYARQLQKQIQASKTMELSLQAREERYRTIMKAVSEGVIIIDRGFVIIDINEKAAGMYGYDKAEMVGKASSAFSLRADADLLKSHVETVLATGWYEAEEQHFRKDGTPIYVEVQVTQINLQGEDHYLAVIRDITQRVMRDLELRESEEKFRQLFDMESDAILLVDNDTSKIHEVNESACLLYGYSREELLTMNIWEISAEPEATREVIRLRPEKIPHRLHRRKDGSIVPVEISIRYFNWRGQSLHVSAIRDISSRIAAENEKRALEAQFHEAQKMESIGTLAGGIAHDFNNLLMSIMGNCTLALMTHQPDDPCTGYLKNIKRISNSGATLARQLLGFARGGKYEPKPTSLNELLSYQNQLFSRTNKNLTLREDFEGDLWTTEIDRGQIEQVLLNIYVNSHHAMPNGGVIYVKTENIHIETEITSPFPMKKGRYVKLSIRDTGVGMDEMTRKRIFEPFFTTKEKGRGTGLGMASVYGIVKNHGGYIDVISSLGQGTTVSILLPVTDKVVAESQHLLEEGFTRGSGTILLVDDEDPILEVTGQMIELLGYRMIPVTSGREAIRLYKERREPIDLVILDVVMPEMGGEETFDRLKEIDPEVKVLVSSGFNFDERAAGMLSRGAKDFIQKPFDVDTLSVKLANIFEAN